MTIKRRFEFPSAVVASYFATDLMEIKIHRYAWCEWAVVVILEDESKKEAVDRLASARSGKPTDEWSEK